MADRWDEMAHAAAERRAARETRRVVVAERDQLLGIEHEMAWFRAHPKLAPVAERELAVFGHQRSSARPKPFGFIVPESDLWDQFIDDDSRLGWSSRFERVMFPMVGRRTCGALIAYSVQGEAGSSAFVLYDSVIGALVLQYEPGARGARLDPEMYRLLHAIQEYFRLEHDRRRARQWESMVAIEVFEDQRLVVIAFNSNVLQPRHVLNLMAFRIDGDDVAVADRTLTLVWKIVVDDDVTQPGVFMCKSGDSVCLVGCTVPFELQYYAAETGERLKTQELIGSVDVDEVDLGTSIFSLTPSESADRVYAHYQKALYDGRGSGRHVFTANFMVPDGEFVNMPRVLFNTRTPRFRVVCEPEGYWMYYINGRSTPKERYIVFRPSDESKRELVFTEVPKRKHGTVDRDDSDEDENEELLLEHLFYVPDTNRLVVISDDASIVSYSLTAFHATGYAPNAMASAPRSTRRAIDTMMQLRTFEELGTPVSALPNELMFRIFAYL